MSAQHLQHILEVGERIKIALERGQVDTYLDLVDKRGTLLDTLSSYGPPPEIDAEWQTLASALSAQHAELIEAADAQRRRMQDAIDRIEQVKAAQRSYHQPAARPSILNENLRV